MGSFAPAIHSRLSIEPELSADESEMLELLTNSPSLKATLISSPVICPRTVDVF